MINTSEFRSGNIVQGQKLSIPRLEIHSNGYMRLTAYGIYMIELGNLDVEPIPLTPELLERCGFKANGDDNAPYWRIITQGNALFTLQATVNPAQFKVWFDNPTCIFIPMAFLHQLQNLYHALTGEELAIHL